MAKSIATGIAAHIAVIHGQATTTTQDIADVYGRRHEYVMKIVRQRMIEAGEWGVPNFWDTPYTNPQNGQTYTVIRMTKKGFHFVVGKFTGARAVQHQIAFADEFERMEAALLAHPASVDPASVNVRALLLGGMRTTAELPLPGEVAHAIDQRAWALAHDAYELLRQHLVKRMHYRHVKGYATRTLDTPAALADIASTTLGNALAHTAHREMRYALGGIRAALRAAQEAQTQLQAHMAACTPQDPSNTQGANHDDI